jgi:hypothetical protein
MKKRNKNFRFPLAKVRKIIQRNEEIGKIDSSIPFIICKYFQSWKDNLGQFLRFLAHFDLMENWPNWPKIAKSLEYYLKNMMEQLKTEYAGQKVKLTPSHL